MGILSTDDLINSRNMLFELAGFIGFYIVIHSVLFRFFRWGQWWGWALLEVSKEFSGG